MSLPLIDRSLPIDRQKIRMETVTAITVRTGLAPTREKQVEVSVHKKMRIALRIQQAHRRHGMNRSAWI